MGELTDNPQEYPFLYQNDALGAKTRIRIMWFSGSRTCGCKNSSSGLQWKCGERIYSYPARHHTLKEGNGSDGGSEKESRRTVIFKKPFSGIVLLKDLKRLLPGVHKAHRIIFFSQEIAQKCSDLPVVLYDNNVRHYFTSCPVTASKWYFTIPSAWSKALHWM